MKEIFEYLFKNGRAPGKFKNLLRPLNIDPRSIQSILCVTVLIANNSYTVLTEGTGPQGSISVAMFVFKEKMFAIF
jgi:hypothetical protein